MAIDRAATLKQAERLLCEGKLDLAIAEYARVVEDNPRDWNTGNVLGDLYARAGRVDRAVEQFTRIADGLYGQGFVQKAGAIYRKILRIKPDDDHALLQAGEIAEGQGLLRDARRHLGAVLDRRRLTGDEAGAAQVAARLASLGGADEPKPLLEVEAHLRAGRDVDGLVLARLVLQGDPGKRQEVAALGWALAEVIPDVALQVVELVADDALSRYDWPSAAATLQEFVTRVPSHIPALMRLVEVCVDGALEATMYGAQAQLADAYIAAGMGAEARSIAEDLVAREPWERVNVERFRRSLQLLGEADPDAVIAARLSGQSPFMSTELGAGSAELFGPGDLDGVFADLRDEATHRLGLDSAREEYVRGLELHQAGRIDECIPALQAGSRDPRLRFDAASLLARIFRQRGMVPQAIEAFEWAAEAPAPSAEEVQRLLYELADTLESFGESARSLAVFMELQVGADGYRDVSARVDRLSKAQARG